MPNLKISVSKYELFDLVTVQQVWHPQTWITDHAFTILCIPAVYPEIAALEALGYEPFLTTQRDHGHKTAIVCSRYYRVRPVATTAWLLQTNITLENAASS
jgi:hypothetical protein